MFLRVKNGNIGLNEFITRFLYTETVVQRCFVKKGVLKNLTEFRGKQLCQSRFLNKVAGLRPLCRPLLSK